MKTLSLLIALVALLAACGGGGGSGNWSRAEHQALTQDCIEVTLADEDWSRDGASRFCECLLGKMETHYTAERTGTLINGEVMPSPAEGEVWSGAAMACIVLEESASAPTKSGTQSAYGYAADVLEIGTIIKGVDERIQTMASEATDDPSLMSDEGWLADLDHEQALVLEVQQRLATMNPPAAFQEAHDLLVEGVDEHAIALELLERACDESDDNLLNEAADHMDKAASLMGQASAAMPE